MAHSCILGVMPKFCGSIPSHRTFVVWWFCELRGDFGLAAERLQVQFPAVPLSDNTLGNCLHSCAVTKQ